jgi:hypothetical protein
MKNNTIKITARYSNLTEAVAATGMDLSYNERDARQTIRYMETDRSLKLVSIFSDDMKQIWYVINSLREDLNLLQKFEPFFSCIHNGPFNVMMPMKGCEASDIENAEFFRQLVTLSKNETNRQLIADCKLIAG